MNSTRYCPMCGGSFDALGRCNCHVSDGATARREPPISLGAVAPDRAARIRARAERLLDIAWSLRSGLAEETLKGHDKSVLGAFVLARMEVEELDRLEAEERAAGASTPTEGP